MCDYSTEQYTFGLLFGGERVKSFWLPSLASGLEFLMKAENLANISIPAVLDSGCLAPSLEYLSIQTHMSNKTL